MLREGGTFHSICQSKETYFQRRGAIVLEPIHSVPSIVPPLRILSGARAFRSRPGEIMPSIYRAEVVSGPGSALIIVCTGSRHFVRFAECHVLPRGESGRMSWRLLSRNSVSDGVCKRSISTEARLLRPDTHVSDEGPNRKQEQENVGLTGGTVPANHPRLILNWGRTRP